MVIGIISAMSEELDILENFLEDKEDIYINNFLFKSGKINNVKVILNVCGIGKVNSTISTQLLISNFKVSHIINLGIAGGINENVHPGDIVIGDTLSQHDFDVTAFGYNFGVIPRLDTSEFKADKMLIDLSIESSKKIENINYHVGKIVSGDQFISSKEKLNWIQKHFNPLAAEMEGGSIAQTCYLNNIPFLILRSISDNGDSNANFDYEQFKEVAIKNSTYIVNEIIKNLD